MKNSRRSESDPSQHSGVVVCGEDLLGGEVGRGVEIEELFSRSKPGEIWMDGGVEDFVREEHRLEFARIVENGDVQLFADTTSPLCRALPLALIDFTYYEKGEGGCLLYDPVAWVEACQTLSMYAGLRGLARQFPLELIKMQCDAIVALQAPGRNKA